MTLRGQSYRRTLGWRKLLLGLGCTGVAVTGGWIGVSFVSADPPAAAPIAVAKPDATPATPASPVSDYSSSYVAVFGDSKQGITREELGEFLIARHGEKVEHLINRRIIEDACKRRGIEVTAKEVEQKLAEDLKDLSLDHNRFVKDFLKARGKTLFEWKEDHLRPELMMLKLCRDQLQVSDEEVKKAYEARYGERLDCRVIEWTKDLKYEAEANYPRIAASEDAFAEAARKQKNDALAAVRGKINPFGRHTLENKELEEQAFALQPGQVSPLIPVPTGGYVLIKCDRRLPANTTIPFEKVRDDLNREVLERKGQREFKNVFEQLQKETKVQRLIERKPSDETPSDFVRAPQAGEARKRAVATLNDGEVVLTREDLGEYLIQRFGTKALPLLINRRIIENASLAANISVTDAEVEAEFLLDAAKKGKQRDEFIKEFLAPSKLSVFQYKEDIIRPRLLLTKMCRDRVKVLDSDLALALEAHYGEKIKCRMILWPNSDESAKLVLQEFGKLRDNPEAFDKKASAQASATLSRNNGLLDEPIAHHATGNVELEKAAFSLQPGEVSSVVGTPEGLLVLKCVERIPPQDVKLEQVREELTKEVFEKKLQAEMPAYFLELEKQAQARSLLRDPNEAVDLKAAVQRELATPSR